MWDGLALDAALDKFATEGGDRVCNGMFRAKCYCSTCALLVT
jgi:hypothetical protein